VARFWRAVRPDDRSDHKTAGHRIALNEQRVFIQGSGSQAAASSRDSSLSSAIYRRSGAAERESRTLLPFAVWFKATKNGFSRDGFAWRICW
jgi:hypothetical protein